MKFFYAFLVISITVLFSGCSRDTITDPGNGNKETGKMLLKFNKTETPSNVTSVTAELTRTGFNAIKATLNILTDTSAEISLPSIAVGIWHLKVEAKDSLGTVLFRGEADVNIAAGTTTQVSLTLQPTQTNVGSIYIIVKWGSSPSAGGWIDYINNPILKKINLSIDRYGVVSPYVFYDGSKYRLWYMNAGSFGTIGYAESNDGFNFSRTGNQPVMMPYSGSTWESGTICSGPVIKVDNVFWMYYSGSPVGGLSALQTGVATSIDGINWIKRSSPVLTSQGGWEESVVASDVIKIGNIYYMYYSGRNYPVYKIGLATSTDGINWSRYSGNPILVADKEWEGTGVYNPTVVFDNNKYIMVYQNAKSAYPDISFGMATSTDGIHWVKETTNPFFTGQNTANHWANCIHYPCLRKCGNELRVYYSGYDPSADERTIAVLRKLQ